MGRPEKRKEGPTFRRLFILGLILVLLVVPEIVWADPRWYNELEIQGAHIVSEGAYFRFLMVNHYDHPIYVTVNDGDPIYLLPNGSSNYNVIAPQLSVPYEEATYTFREYDKAPQPDRLMGTVDFSVIVLDSNFFDFTVLANIIIPVGLFAIAIAFVIWQRRLLVVKSG